MDNSPSQRSPRRRVAVVGAGPGGISTAIAMHQAGHEVRLFERAPQVMARKLGRIFHRTPWPLTVLRDAVFNHTPFLERVLVNDCLKDAEAQVLALDFG